jgi:hypothetical protein
VALKAQSTPELPPDTATEGHFPARLPTIAVDAVRTLVDAQKRIADALWRRHDLATRRAAVLAPDPARTLPPDTRPKRRERPRAQWIAQRF